MRIIVKYVSSLLVVIFMATLIPFHAFHKHLEEEHFVAINSDTSNHSHHCKLDEIYCQDLLIKNCEHKQHLAESAEKCYFSQYHFIKNITLFSCNFKLVNTFKKLFFEQITINVQNQITILLNNKGPPATSLV